MGVRAIVIITADHEKYCQSAIYCRYSSDSHSVMCYVNK